MPMNTKRQHSPAVRSAFTLIEILVVMVIIAVLMCLLFPAIAAVRNAMNKSHTAARAQVMVNAIKLYRTQYSTWPGQMQGDVDKVYDDSTATRKHAILIDALTNNPRRIFFSDLVENLTSNTLLDAWNRPYVIAIDESGDGVVSNMSSTIGTVTFGPVRVPDQVAIMSWGRNPTNASNRLYSWIR